MIFMKIDGKVVGPWLGLSVLAAPTPCTYERTNKHADDNSLMWGTFRLAPTSRGKNILKTVCNNLVSKKGGGHVFEGDVLMSQYGTYKISIFTSLKIHIAACTRMLQQRSWKTIILRCILIMIVCGFFATCLAISVQCSFQIVPLINTFGAYTDNTIIVTELYSAQVSHVAVEQSILLGDEPHLTSVHLMDGSCDDLPTIMTEKRYFSSDTIKNIAPMYLLPRSSIDYYFSVNLHGGGRGNVDTFFVEGIESIRNFNPNYHTISLQIPVGSQEMSKHLHYFVTRRGF